MNVVVLSEKNGYHARELSRAAAVRGHGCVVCPWPRLVGAVGCGQPIARAAQTVLDRADMVLVRTMPPGTLEQIVFRMDLLGQLAAAGVCVVNPPRAIEIAVDKYLALAKLNAAGLPTPATIVCQKFDDAVAAFDDLGRDVVIKPLFGSEGFGITRVTDPDLAQRAFAQLDRAGSVIYLQKFVDHDGSDLRLFVLGDRVLAAIRRTSGDWRTNVARGARAERFEPTDALCDLALRAARACGCRIAGVDLVQDRAGRVFVLEVNAVPGWRALAPACGIDVAAAVIEHLETASRGTD